MAYHSACHHHREGVLQHFEIFSNGFGIAIVLVVIIASHLLDVGDEPTRNLQ